MIHICKLCQAFFVNYYLKILVKLLLKLNLYFNLLNAQQNDDHKKSKELRKSLVIFKFSNFLSTYVHICRESLIIEFSTTKKEKYLKFQKSKNRGCFMQFLN